MSHTLMAVERVESRLKRGSFHPFVHPKWSRMRLGKMRF